MITENSPYYTNLEDLLHNVLVLLQTAKSTGDDDKHVERLMSYRNHLQTRIAAGETREVNF